MDERLERGRRLARRRMAWASFIFMLGTATTVLGLLLFSPDRLNIAKALGESEGLIKTVYALTTVVIVGYLGISGVEGALRNREE